MPRFIRTELEQELVDAFIETKAVDFEAIGSIVARYGARAARSGTDLTTIVNKHFLINCGWPGPEVGNVILAKPAGESNG